MKNNNITDLIINLKAEYIFIVLGAIFGIMIAFSNPPFHSNDEDRHYYLAYYYSTGRVSPDTLNKLPGLLIPQNLYNIVSSTQGINYFAGDKISRAKIEEDKKIKLEKDKKIFMSLVTYINPISYIPATIGIFIGNFINDNPISLLYAGRIANLIFFLIVVFFAIKLVPIFKATFTMIALSPMVIYQASSVTYDTPILALSLFIVAYIIKLYYQVEQINDKQLIYLLLITFIIHIIKQGYLFIPLLAIILPQEKFVKKNYYWGIIILLVVIYFLATQIWNIYVSSLNLPPFPKFLSDFKYGGDESINIILSNPLEFIYKILMNFITQGKEWLWGAFGRFGYSYTIMNKLILFIYGFVLISVAFLDKGNYKEFDLKTRIKILTVAILGILFIVVGFFVTSTPIGANLVFGIQGRYFIPFISILLLGLYNNTFQFELLTKYKNIFVLIFMFIILTFTVIFINNELWKA